MRVPLVNAIGKAKASEVLATYLKQCNEPPWTSFFIRQNDVVNDQFGRSHFIWTLDTGTNYHILRIGCFPYMKYHCTKRPIQDLRIEDYFFRCIKVAFLDVAQLCYVLAAAFLFRHIQHVGSYRRVLIYFLYEEDTG